ncbi:COP9 signalosome complex subunit 3 [Lotus japonicus]|uniref:COP9 signalosome complex subunit 3 n=1 Tax=Lotus japonicus TaxID=34305 RepID=UPI00258EDADD|nr:COP9 signalosome complex subunit 3 [Lotus japonicus]
MDPLEALAAQIQGLSSTSGDIARLHIILKQADDSLRSESTRLSPLFSQLHPSHHTLGFLYVLEAFTSNSISKEQAETVIPVITGFVAACSVEQIRLAPEKFILVCKRLKDLVMLLEAPIRGVGPLLTAVRKLQLSPAHLTPLHSEFLQLCLLAKCYKTGFSILEDGVSEIEQPRDVFLYCYYGGMICVGLKRFRKALDLLHNVVTAPMTCMNAIAVEAYKKYILVSLIHHGQSQLASSLPKYTSSVAQRNLKHFCQPYIELATTYGTAKIAELEAYVNTNTETFVNDNNLGLVNQVVSSMYKRNIQRLTQTYLTLSLQDIASTVQLNTSKEAEMHVLQMIQDGEIHATINQRDGMVRFLEDPEQYKTCEMIEHIDSSIQRIMELSRKLSTMDEQISCDQLYLSKAGRERPRYDSDDFDVPAKFNI